MLELLNQKFNSFLETYPERRKHYHLKSIYNFLRNFDRIDKYEDKEMVGNLLNKYLDLIKEIDFVTVKESKIFFYDFIVPIGTIYKRNMNFTFLYAPSFFIFWGAIILISLWFLKINHTIGFFIGIGILGTFIFFLLKRRNTNVYGYDY